MFESDSSRSRRWYRSPFGLIVAAGLALLGLGSGYTFGRRALLELRQSRRYAALDAQRAVQRRQPARPAATPAPSPAAQSPVPPSPAGEWTDFRGPERDGIYRETAITTNWSNGLRPLWRQPIGLGYASFSIGGGRAYTIEQRRHQEVVAAYDVGTGREIWTDGWPGEFHESMGGDGPRATPTYHDGRVYALGAEGEFRCLDAATGTSLWRRNILSEAGASNLQWGMAASPLIVDDKVIVQPGGRRSHSIVAYDRTTGAPVWTALDDEASYSSPMLVTIAGRRQLLTVTATRAVGLAPEDGSLLWAFPWENSAHINVAQPILVNDRRVFLSAAYGSGAAVFDVTATGRGFTTQPVWANSQMKNRFQTSVLLNGYVYGLDEGILTCLDVNTGERKWKGGRYGYGQVILVDHSLIVLSEEGQLVLVEATPDQFHEAAQVPVLHGRSWNVPAIAAGTLLLRNGTEMAAFDLRK